MTDNQKEAIRLVGEIEKNMSKLNELWHLDMDGVSTVVDTDYPFVASFDELSLDVLTWKQTCEEVLTKSTWKYFNDIAGPGFTCEFYTMKELANHVEESCRTGVNLDDISIEDPDGNELKITINLSYD